MNAQESAMLCRYVKACCPQQAIDEHTPLAWAAHLAGVQYADAYEAAKQITSKQAFVTIAEVLAVVRQIRAKRIAEAPHPVPPPGLTEPEERAWIAEARRRIGDGEVLAEAVGRTLEQRNLPELRALITRGPQTEETSDA